MNHDRFEELLTLELDGEITSAERAELDAMIAASADLAERARQERELVVLLRGQGARHAPANLAGAVREQLNTANVVSVGSGGRRHRGLFSYAAAAAIFIAAGISVVVFKNEGDSTRYALSDTSSEGTRLNLQKNFSSVESPALQAPEGGVAGAAARSRNVTPEEVESFAADKVTESTELQSSASNEAAIAAVPAAQPAPAPAPPAPAQDFRNKDFDSRSNEFFGGIASAAAGEQKKRAEMPEKEIRESDHFKAFSTLSDSALPPEGAASSPVTESYYYDLLGEKSKEDSPARWDYGNGEPGKLPGTPAAPAAVDFEDAFVSIPEGVLQEQTLGSHAEMKALVVSNDGLILLDTPWEQTAVNFLNSRLELPPEGRLPDTRFAVAEMPDEEKISTLAEQYLEQNQRAIAPSQLQARGRQVRVLLPYKESGEAIIAATGGELDFASRKGEARALDGTGSVSSGNIVRSQDAVKLLRQSQSAKQVETFARAPQSKLKQAGTILQLLDEIIEQAGGKLSFVTARREAALGIEPKEVMTPIPGGSEAQFAVYEFEQEGQAEQALRDLPGQRAGLPPMVRIERAELVRAAGQSRLVVPIEPTPLPTTAPPPQ